MKSELIACKETLLKFVDKEKQWHKDMTLVVESEKTLKRKYDELVRKLQEKEKELEGGIIPLVAQSNEQTIVQAMSRVILKRL